MCAKFIGQCGHGNRPHSLPLPPSAEGYELYDLVKDPYEVNNIYSSAAKVSGTAALLL